ncbi:MAG: peptide deformylase [Candidatus Komeilibacteria bacterium]|jgi:peptide deformylase|nr:peptide deformylase [Candidatus Komeilibacteria bacterium]MBT4447660.1 peptide deformylase [Candidatus Komeilibacteria bacterium]
MFKIAKYPDPILRKTAKPISDFNDELKKMASDMAEVMYEDDGIGLAAPQVSKSLRLIVIGLGHGDFKTYVNPEITFFSKEKTKTDEGCLSLPKIFGDVIRPKKIHVKYYDLDGQVHKEKLKGIDSVILQHEVDHLNGILFIDRVEKINQGQELLDALKKQLDEQAK